MIGRRSAGGLSRTPGRNNYVSERGANTSFAESKQGILYPMHQGEGALFVKRASEIYRLRFDVANLVMRHTEQQNSKIARCGVCSIYRLLKSMRPAVSRDTNAGLRDEFFQQKACLKACRLL